MNLVQQLTRDEGRKLNAYKDSLGLWTIGVGHLIDPSRGAHPPKGMKMPNGVIDTACSITSEQCDALLSEDIAEHTAALHKALPWVTDMDAVRHAVLVNMTFNMGIAKLICFKNTLSLIKDRKWDEASKAMLQSKWATQVKGRADRLSQQMRTGDWV